MTNRRPGQRWVNLTKVRDSALPNWAMSGTALSHWTALDHNCFILALAFFTFNNFSWLNKKQIVFTASQLVFWLENFDHICTFVQGEYPVTITLKYAGEKYHDNCPLTHFISDKQAWRHKKSETSSTLKWQA